MKRKPFASSHTVHSLALELGVIGESTLSALTWVTGHVYITGLLLCVYVGGRGVCMCAVCVCEPAFWRTGNAAKCGAAGGEAELLPTAAPSTTGGLQSTQN